ncbi:DUF2321 domain-containing protein [Haloarchaeobius litoreus]|uniref:DUF2321 domain-containing protein n=1 Tax=Haloarchaeobius litoreus TaxID=755306 RepID=A0ABD6DEC1_9EURY
MADYEPMQVCAENGHQITVYYDSQPTTRQDFCEQCGSETIHQCPECDSIIRGNYQVDGVAGSFDKDVPSYCHGCGEAYPWVQQS